MPSDAAWLSFLRCTDLEALSYKASSEERALDNQRLLATGRRSWKTLKGEGYESVWPPKLSYGDLNRQPTMTGSFPLRNQYISEYIHNETGISRTPKQVGSRLQRLKDTCKDCWSLLLHIWQNAPLKLLMQIPSMSPYMDQHTAPSPPLHYSYTQILGTSSEILIHSPYPLLRQSMVLVYRDGTDLPLYSEVAFLLCKGWMGSSEWTYSTFLVPKIWDHLSCCYAELTHLHIEHRLVSLSLSRSSESHDPLSLVDPTIKIVYRFSPLQTHTIVEAQTPDSYFSMPASCDQF
ncbi:hypothetical protein Hypma_008520 [Hypsizygus marmoreus]|uniref:TEA domain-containing protein n=1 Tax=Hypsizygus marmoreus TaxID=39966 RepID=A0A369JXK0_HYPMA|nr:hypothetical protein Hypma_008520 [Hypsizygus marmoreus]